MGSLMGSSCVGYDAIGHGLASSVFPYLSNQGLYKNGHSHSDPEPALSDGSRERAVAEAVTRPSC